MSSNDEKDIFYNDLDRDLLGDDPNPGNGPEVRGPPNLMDREDLSFFSPESMKDKIGSRVENPTNQI